MIIIFALFFQFFTLRNAMGQNESDFEKSEKVYSD